MVLAGAGCGKTRVITEKIAYLISRLGVSHSAIFAITFTNKAAKEMSQRASKMVRLGEGETLNISTFHSLGLRILREEIKHTPYRYGFSIFDTSEVRNVLKDLLPKGSKGDLINQTQWQISTWKNEGLLAEDVTAGSPLMREVYLQYQQRMIDFNALDFDDLILQTLSLFHTQNEILQQWQERMRFVLVDEYQDTNASQYRLLQLLVAKHRNLICVGDDDQSIYGWRGAQPENINLLKNDFPDLQVVKLEQNYRSSQTILEAAHHVIKNNPHEFEKKLWSDLGSGDKIVVRTFPSAEEEVQQLAAEIDYRRILDKRRYSDFAVLYRSNHQAKLVESVFRLKDIPYVMSGGRSFFDFTEVKDVMAYMRLLCNPNDNAAFLRVINTPRRGIGSTSVAQLAKNAEKNSFGFFKAAGHDLGLGGINTGTAEKIRTFQKQIRNYQKRVLAGEDAFVIVNDLVKDIDYLSWIEQTSKDRTAKTNRKKLVTDFLKFLQGFSKNQSMSLLDVTAQMTLQNNQDGEKKEDAVQMMTLHAAKGLEFPVVYMVGVEEGILPHRNSLEEDSVEEERRLMYVGMTRAMQHLTLSYVKKRKARFGQEEDLTQTGPSRFLDELPQNCIEGYGKKTKQSEEQQKASRKKHLQALKDMLQ